MTAPILAVARNLVSAIRLLHVVSVFGDDPRVRIHWTIAPGSRFSSQTDEYLVRRGVRLTPWKRACDRRYALIVATSANGDLELLDGPLMLLPHGAGFSRVVAPGQTAPAGLAASQLLRGGRVVAEVIGLEHEDQRARLAAHCPEAAPHGVVLGDPVRDRMSAGAPLRALYRGALAVTDRQALVVLSSTWGPNSLFDAHPDLPARLTAALPADEYRLAAIVHPNAAADMGAWEVGRLLSRARGAGLELIAPDRWESAVLAADLVVGDHGSVALYAAAAGIRVLLGAYDGAQIVADSPMATLSVRLPRLDLAASMAPQIRNGLAQEVDDAAYTGAREAADLVGRSLEVTKRAAYRLLDLPDPPWVPRPRAPEPAWVDKQPRRAHLVLVDRCDEDQAELRIRRFAAGVDPDLLSSGGQTELCRHFAVDAYELDQALRENAEVVLLEPAAESRDLIRALGRLLDTRAVCARVAGAVVGPGRCVLVAEGCGALELRMGAPDLDATVLPSILLALADEGQLGMPGAAERLRTTGVTVLLGNAATCVRAYELTGDEPSKPC
jgi:hypothetical protein